jgi:mono/diheme cytochrome c family protein
VAATPGRAVALLLVMACVLLPSALAQSPTLSVAGRESTRTYSREELLAHPGVRDVTVADSVYRRPMTYRALPLAELLKGSGIGADDYVQARAIDNFSVSIPGGLVSATGTASAEAFLAVEDPATPWPPIPNTPDKAGAGPFYIVWRLAPSASVSSEYWAYRLAALAVIDSPVKRWPVLAVGTDVPADDRLRVGLDRFVALCMGCHRFDGAGEGGQGPDLGRPMNVTEYFRRPALEKLIRDPASVREWPDQKMPGFPDSSPSDADLDAIVDWLAYKARRQR